MPQAARLGDPHTCPLSTPLPHGGGVIAGPGEASVLIAYLPAATQGTTCACGLGPPNTIVAGSASVKIGYVSAARLGDPTSHGGTIVAGCMDVLIG